VCFFFLEKSRTDRFEDLNADVRWTSACRQLDGGNSIIFLPIGKKNANKSGRYLQKRQLSSESCLFCSFLYSRFFLLSVCQRTSGAGAPIASPGGKLSWELPKAIPMTEEECGRKCYNDCHS